MEADKRKRIRGGYGKIRASKDKVSPYHGGENVRRSRLPENRPIYRGFNRGSRVGREEKIPCE